MLIYSQNRIFHDLQHLMKYYSEFYIKVFGFLGPLFPNPEFTFLQRVHSAELFNQKRQKILPPGSIFLIL